MTRIITPDGEPFEDLEDLVYHNEPTKEYELSEDRGIAYSDYLEARDVSALLDHPGYKTMLRWATRDVERTKDTRANFQCRSDSDKPKEQILNREMEDAVMFKKRLQQWVEEAANVPKPV